MKKSLLLFYFLLYCFLCQGQKITVSQIGYFNFIFDDPVINDSVLRSSVKFLFSGKNDSVQQVLLNAADTAFYNTITQALFSIPTRDLYEINIDSVYKTDSLYYLKCLFLCRNDEFTDLLGIVRVPFTVLKNGEIKYRNYFLVNVVPDLVKAGNIYTSKENEGNLDTISTFIKETRKRFGIKNSARALYYIHYPDKRNPYSALGITYFTLALQGRTVDIGNGIAILDKRGKGFYKHELVHYIAVDVNLSNFFKEGFASYLGGSSSECNIQCDYEGLLSFLVKNNKDSVIQNIVRMKFEPPILYATQYYPLGSFTVYLIVKKYGADFLSNPKVRSAIQTNSTDEFLASIKASLLPTGITLENFYIEELKKYLHR